MKLRNSIYLFFPALAACGNPATESPVEALPGNYEVSSEVLSKVKQWDYCLKASEVGNWPHPLVRKIVDTDKRCSKKSTDRQGNLATGVYACSNNLNAKTPVEIRSYEARIEADKLSIVHKTSWDYEPGMSEDEKKGVDQLNAGNALPDINYSATRTGDC